MKEAYIADLKPGTSISTTFLVRAKDRKTARNGNAYLDLEFQDSSGTIKAKLWDCDSVELDFEADDVVKVTAGVELYQGNPQLSLRKVVKCREAEVDLADYLPHSAQNSEELFKGLLSRIQKMPQGPLQALLLRVFNDPETARKFRQAPAAMSYHHAFIGGLIEHVSSLVGLGDRVCDHYPFLDRDLILAALLLHDIGKIEELSFTRGFGYSRRGQLIGHISMGVEMVRDKVREIPDFPPELWDRLQHAILSHHGKLEFGSPKEPMFMEALAVNYLDDLDSKLEAMLEQYATDKDRPGDFTARSRPLGRELLKPPTEHEPAPAPAAAPGRAPTPAKSGSLKF
ncbi:MAG TPA: HD domain-containing protein [Terriglobia bacterium]|nr:HD domain-containing protein [Terriglobia bacterium]